MFDKAKFSHALFNRSTDETPHFYATVQTAFDLQVAQIHVRAKLEAIRMDATSAVQVGVLWLKQPLSGVTLGAEFAVEPRFTALLPSQSIALEAEYSFASSLASLQPIDPILFLTSQTFEATLWAYMPLPTASFKAEYGVETNATALVPISAPSLGAAYEVIPSLHSYMPLPSTTVPVQFDLTMKVIRSQESDELILEGINLKPGSILVIDTDTLDVEVDGVPRVDAWVLGSTFFQMKKGENILTFTDNAKSRKLDTTVVWADRYL